MSGVCLTLKDVHISLHGKALLQVNTRIEPGATLTVMGPSGVGKSSLLAYVAGFLSSDFSARGEIFLGERCLNGLPSDQRGIGLLFQDPLLFPHLSVAQNLLFAAPRNVSHRQQQVDQALEAVGLLSGGQKARVALQRLLLSQPKAVLLDEPFSRLDAHLRQDIRQHVFQTLRDAALPTILVTHDVEDAAASGGSVIELS
jgi:putative thiamine transport system ATP-binding protein